MSPQRPIQMADIENQVRSECIICKEQEGTLKSRTEHFQGCLCRHVVYHDTCWDNFIKSEYGNYCPTCRKAVIRQPQNQLRDIVVQPHENEDLDQPPSLCRRFFEFYLFCLHLYICVLATLSFISEQMELLIQIILCIQLFYSCYNCVSATLDFTFNSRLSVAFDTLNYIDSRFVILSQTVQWPFNCILRRMCCCVYLWSWIVTLRLAIYIMMIVFISKIVDFKFAYAVFMAQICELSLYISFIIVCGILSCVMHIYDLSTNQERINQ
jgi:hypothetical protein